MKKKPAKEMKPAPMDAERPARLQAWWEADRKKFADNAADDAMASGYWQNYPFMAGLLNGCEDAAAVAAAMQSLDSVHRAATQYLLTLAAKADVDGTPLWPAMVLCERLTARGESKAGPFGTWPDCYRDATVSDAERSVMDAGDAAFMQLATRLEIKIPACLSQTFTKDDLRKMTGLADTALTDYTRRSGVKVPGRGAKNYRWQTNEVIKICQTIIDISQDATAREKCKQEIQRLKNIPS